MGAVTFRFTRQKGPLLLGSCYLRAAVTFRWLKNVSDSNSHLDKADVQIHEYVYFKSFPNYSHKQS